MERTQSTPATDNLLALRQVNETVWQAAERAGEQGELAFLCECGHDYCAGDVLLTDREYRIIREAPGCRMVAPGHVDERTERLLVKRVNYWVVDDAR